MARILVIHWNAAEAAARAERLRGEGFETSCFTDQRDGAGFRALRENPPDAVVIDLARLPSHGQAVGIALRAQKATRMVPLVFIEADPEKTARVRGLLPDAVFTTWPRIGAALRRALRHPLQNARSFPARSPATPARRSPRNCAYGKAPWWRWFTRPRVLRPSSPHCLRARAWRGAWAAPM